MRLGSGDWHDGGDGPRAEGRALFLASIELQAPEVIAELRDSVLPNRRNLWRWAKGWNLTDQWLLEFAEEVLELWAHFPDGHPIPATWPTLPAGGGWGFRAGGGGWRLNPQTRRRRYIPDGHVLPHWDPTGETWAEYRAKANRRLTEYKAEVEARAEMSGFERVPSKRGRRGGDPELHFDWLVRFQVLGESLASVASFPGGGRSSVDLRSVQDAVRTTADLIGLARRSVSGHE
jgi:hypothetical protein